MPFVLQGTTPMLRLTVMQDGELLDLSDFSIFELTVGQRGVGEIVYTTEPIVDAENSQVSYVFSEAETMKMRDDRRIVWQLRLGKTDLTMPDGVLIVGTVEGYLSPYELFTKRRIS